MSEIGPKNKTYSYKLFDQIAETYDFLNILLSLGIDRLWRKKIIRLLNKTKVDNALDMATGTGDMAILLAQSPEMLQLLLNQGADPLLANQFGDTLLLLMVQRDQLQMVKLLLKYGANPNQANNYGETALTESSWRKQQTIYELLQSYGHR